MTYGAGDGFTPVQNFELTGVVSWGVGCADAPVVSNTELIMLMYPKCRREAEVAFLLGTYMELVDREVTGKQKELMVGTVRGVLRAKVEQLASRAAPQINFPPGWI